MRKCKPALQCMAICHTWTDPIRLRPFGKEVEKKEDKEDKEDLGKFVYSIFGVHPCLPALFV